MSFSLNGANLLPAFLVGLAGGRLRKLFGLRQVRLACGLLILGFGLFGLWRAAGGLLTDGMPDHWIDVLCIAPGAEA